MHILSNLFANKEYINVFKMSLPFWARKSPPWEFQKVGKYRMMSSNCKVL